MVAAPIAREAGNHMNAYCVVTVDGIRARFFCLEKSEQTGIGASQFLVEQPVVLFFSVLVLLGCVLWSVACCGRRPAGGHMPGHGVDDHRDQHTDEMRRRFAKQIAEETLKLTERYKPHTLVLAAEKQMLGFLRNALNVPPKASFEVKEVPKDLSRLSPQELQRHLAADGVLPARNKPAVCAI